MGSAGDRPAAGDRPPPGALPPSAVRRDRLRDGWEGPAGKVARGGRRPPPVGAPSLPSPSVTAPRQQQLAESRGRGNRITRRRALLLLSWGGRAAPPTARPLSHLPPSSGVPGSGRTVLSAPRASSRRRAGGVPSVTPPSLSREGAEPSARGPRRCRLPTRPVLKHGPRSLTRARVRGSSESRRGAMKVKGLRARGGIPRPLPVRRGRTTGPSRPPRRGGGARAYALGPERW